VHVFFLQSLKNEHVNPKCFPDRLEVRIVYSNVSGGREPRTVNV